jgi:uncharacterized RDD family membrane protein YckC
MTQPPDDLERRPDGSSPDDAVAPEDQPTVAWTPPEPPAPPAPDEGPPPGDAPGGDLPADDTPPGEAPMTGWTPTQPAPLDVPAPAQPDATVPASPIISASPSVPSDAAGPPGVADPSAVPAAPLVAWAAPAAADAAPGREGYVIAGMGARLVAYFIDGLIVAIIPTILTLLVVDYTDMIRQTIDASRTGATAAQTTITFAVTPQLILVTLISLALQYLYFIGFWTSGGRATPGMRGLRMQVVDAAMGGTLSLGAATKRFIAMGYPLGLLILVPALQSAAGVAQFALSLFLFFTAITNDRRQGLHDKWANSLVIRSTISGDGAVLVGCLLLIVIVVGVGIIASVLAVAAMGPELQDLMRELEQTT